MAEERVVKVPMSVDLIRRMDRALSEARGGFTTRAAFVTEAVEQLLVEISYEPAPPEPVIAPASAERSPPTWPEDASRVPLPVQMGEDREMLQRLPNQELPAMTLSDLDATALWLPSRGAVVNEGVARVENEPLLGLHNRDYPSFWAAHKLASYTREGLVLWQDYVSRATAEAWQFSAGSEATRARGPWPPPNSPVSRQPREVAVGRARVSVVRDRIGAAAPTRT